MSAPLQKDAVELDLGRYELRVGGGSVQLERIPMKLLILLVENHDKLVSREAIIERLWGRDVFLDAEQGINTAVRKIRMALRDDSEKPRFLQTVVGKGYRFVGQINVVGGVTSAEGSAQTRPTIRSIAVLPLRNLSAASNDEYFADGMTDQLITCIARTCSLRVPSYTSVARYKGSNRSLPQIARELQVDAIVEGSVMRSGEEVRITAQLIYAPRDEHLWAEEYQRSLRDILGLQREVAVEIAHQVRAALVSPSRTVVPAGIVDPAAYDFYLRGRSYWNQRSEGALHKAVEQFNRAIEIDPGYGSAWSGMADCYTTLGYLAYISPLDAFPRAYQAATKALARDPSLSEAHASLAYYYLYHAWDWEIAEREFATAIELNPNYAIAHDWYSYFLLAMGRIAEAWKEITRARELDPLSVLISCDVGFNLYYQRDYDAAINQLQATLEINPNFYLAYLWIGRSYQQKKMFAEAIEWFKRSDEVLPDWIVTVAAMGNAYGEWGKRMEAEQILRRLDRLSRQKFVTHYGVALVHSAVGDNDRAFEWLHRGYEGRSHWLVWLTRDPRWKLIRPDPRFAELAGRLRLPD
jgi:TolB-like protein/Tfp pilus assembly protein PilF